MPNMRKIHWRSTMQRDRQIRGTTQPGRPSVKIAHRDRDRGAIEDRVRSSKAVSYYFIPASNVCDGRGLPRAHPALILSKSARSCDHEHDICRSLLSAAANIACGPSRDRASGRGRLGIPISDRTVCAMGLAETCPHTQCDISLYYGRSVGRYTTPLPMGHTRYGHDRTPCRCPLTYIRYTVRIHTRGQTQRVHMVESQNHKKSNINHLIIHH